MKMMQLWTTHTLVMNNKMNGIVISLIDEFYAHADGVLGVPEAQV